MNYSATVVLGKATRPRQLRKLRNHTVILGWSGKAPQIISELTIANQNVRKPRLVLVSEKPTEQIEKEIRISVGNLGKLKIHYLSSDLRNSELLEMIGISRAKSVIVLAEATHSDPQLLQSISALQGKAKAIVTEFEDRQLASRFSNVVSVDSQAVLAKVIAQATRNEDIGNIFRDLLDFSGDEIYFASIPALSGKTYADAILAFNQASVIGLVDDGVAKVNPPMDTLLTRETRVIAIAEDDDQVIYTGVREDIAQTKLEPKLRATQAPTDLLIVGWSKLGQKVLTELATFLPKGSTVQIVAQKNLAKDLDLAALNFENMSISTHLFEPSDSEIEVIKTLKFNEAIILSYNQLSASGEDDPRAQQITSELKSLGSRVVFAADEAVGRLGSLLIAQLSENPQLEGVFSDLFDATGATMNVRSITAYVSEGKSVSFAELAAIARNFGESAIGYRSANGAVGDPITGVLLNPAKTMEFVPAKGDALVVVGSL